MTDNPDDLAQVFHFDLYGKRDEKYDFLNQNSLKTINWNELSPNAPNFFLVKKDFDQSGNYETGFKVDELFIQNNAGLATEFDELSIKNTKNEAEKLLKDLKDFTSKEVLLKYNLDNKKIEKVESAIKDIKKNNPIITTIDYRPFDFKYTIYTGVSNGIMGRPRDAIMKHMLKKNISLLICRQQTSFDFQHIFISNKISERCSVSLQTGEVNYVFPLYLYPESKDLFSSNERTPNLNKEIVNKIATGLELKFVNEPIESGVETLQCNVSTPDDPLRTTIAPIDILDYIYAILHSPTYREKYKEFLKIDFPRVPYPSNAEMFWALVKLGGELRQIHLLESPIVENFITQYPIDGNNMVEKIRYVETMHCNVSTGRVYINETQYFDNVPESAWNFYIGGYQPAQKWIKDRRERTLEFEDILHYQKIIVALSETDRLMNKIDLLGVE